MITHIETTTQILPSVPNNSVNCRAYITPNGDRYTSIDSIFGVKEEPNQVSWHQSLSDNSKSKNRKDTDAGQIAAVREMIESFISNNENPTKGHRPAHIKSFNQLKFKLRKIDNVIAHNVVLYSDTIQVAGLVDCIADYCGVASIICYEASADPSKRDNSDDYVLRCTFAALAWYELTGQLIENVVILMYVDGGMTPFEFKTNIHNRIVHLVEIVKEYLECNPLPILTHK